MLVVVDGMGGYVKGEVVFLIVVDIIKLYYGLVVVYFRGNCGDVVMIFISVVNKFIKDEVWINFVYKDMGIIVVVVIFYYKVENGDFVNYMIIGYVGDLCCYGLCGDVFR